MNEQPLLKVYDEEEIKALLNDKVRLVYVDTGGEEFVVRYEDLPDAIVDISDKFNQQVNLKVYDFETFNMEPMLTTIGEFLDECKPEVRKDIIDRLVKLQLGEDEVKDYKVINEDMLEKVMECLEEKDDEDTKVFSEIEMER